MTILQIHKYFSRERGGGSVTAFFETVQLLKKKKQKVMIFSMKDETNEFSEYEEFFAEHFDINEAKNFWQKIKLVPRIIYNREAQKKLEKLLEKEKPDVAHVHNISHYLTPAIIHTLKKHKIPIVFKLSDYKAICPNYKLFNKGKICEKCKKHQYVNCFLNNCIKNNFFASFIGMIEAYAHWFLGSYKKIDFFLAPSEFMKNKCVDFGIPEEKIKILRNVINIENFNFESDFVEDDYLLNYGRISEEKGIGYLIKAFKELVENNSEIKTKLFIAGKGPEEKELKKLVKSFNLEKRIIFKGFQKGNNLQDLIRRSKGVIVSSVWYDNSPLVISESQLLRKPVIISDRGGSKEMILENESGFVYSAENIGELEKKMLELLLLSSDKRKEMGELGRKNIMKINNEDFYYSQLMKFYQEALNKNK